MSEAIDNVDAVEASQEAEAQAERVPHVKVRRGTVVSAKMQKTVVVLVERQIRHKRYKKYVRSEKRYAVHDEIGCQEGDRVVIRETRPLSKTKRWTVARKLD